MERLTERDDVGIARFAGNHSPLENTKKIPILLERLASYEDIGLEPEELQVFAPMQREFNQNLGALRYFYELVKAGVQKQIIVLPEVSDRDREGVRDLLCDDLNEWVHDPSVGLYGPTEGEEKLLKALIAGLAIKEG